jgi:hypothetical protein
MNFGCFLSRPFIVPVHNLMIGLSVHMCTQERMLGGGTLGGSLTAACLALNLGKRLVGMEISVNMLMEYSSVGYTHISIEHDSVKMGLVVIKRCVFHYVR